jgi:hypothetical protein
VVASNQFALPIKIRGVTTTGDFGQTNTCPAPPATLAAGASCQVNVTFTPTQPSTRKGLVTIAGSAPITPQTIALVGAATDLSLSVPRLNFGSHAVGTTSGARMVTVTNVGTVPVNFTGSGIVSPEPTWLTSSSRPTPAAPARRPWRCWVQGPEAL